MNFEMKENLLVMFWLVAGVALGAAIFYFVGIPFSDRFLGGHNTFGALFIVRPLCVVIGIATGVLVGAFIGGLRRI